VDEGLPVSYQVLEEGIPVYAADGARVGTVDHVVAATAQDIFHGIVLRHESTYCFIEADQVASLHERGVDLRINAAEAARLPPTAATAPPIRGGDDEVKPTPWSHLVGLLGGNARRSR
jgi:uncharacterized protein YrrD